MQNRNGKKCPRMCSSHYKGQIRTPYQGCIQDFFRRGGKSQRYPLRMQPCMIFPATLVYRDVYICYKTEMKTPLRIWPFIYIQKNFGGSQHTCIWEQEVTLWTISRILCSHRSYTMYLDDCFAILL